jgi:hypothetical protein
MTRCAPIATIIRFWSCSGTEESDSGLRVVPRVGAEDIPRQPPGRRRYMRTLLTEPGFELL